MTINVLVLIFGAILFNAYNGCQARSCPLQADTYVEGERETNSFEGYAENTIQPEIYLFFSHQVESHLSLSKTIDEKLLGTSSRSKISICHKKITARGPPQFS